VKLRSIALITAVLVMAGGAGLAAVVHRQLQPMVQGSGDGTELRLFSVERGSSMGQVARELEAAALVRDARALELLARLRGCAEKIQAGEYELSATWTPWQILDRITSGQVKTYTTVLPEGIRASEIAERLEQASLVDAESFLAVVRDESFVASLGIGAETLEGYLYPETYELPRSLPPEEVAKIMIAQFERAWHEIEPAAREQALSKHEIVTLASIVEKETAEPSERPLIAAVFLNRLERRMRLETDPAVIYGIENFDGNLRRHHLRDADNPYNTYQIAGLPPGPIANPGIDALRAVVEPAESDYLYFVSKNDGTHHFSRSYREHVNAVNRYQRRGRSRSQ
jgi:UPF0755 protein